MIKRFSFLLFGLTFAIFIIFASGTVDSSDGLQYLTVARNWYYRGEPIIFTNPKNEYRDQDGGNNIYMNYVQGKNHKFYSTTGLGFSLAYLPAVCLTDIVYRLNQIQPNLKHFPLVSDWLILLLASFTNAFFAGLLVIIFFHYLLSLKLKIKTAFWLSIFSLLATNLAVYAKHAFPHLMFSTFLLLTFYLIKRYARYGKKSLLFRAGLSFGLVIISYNQTFWLTLPPLFFYYWLSVKRKNIQDLLWFILGVLPFYGIYTWYENLKSTPLSSPINLINIYGKGYLFSHFPKNVFFEGIYGQLFSSGRSLFLYSPPLLIPLLFWHKLKKEIRPEVVAFTSLLIIYLLFYARQIEVLFGYNSLWHGEFSWGPRYLLPTLPLGLLLSAWLYPRLRLLEKILVFFPLLVVGLYISFIGLSIPYQIKLSETNHDIYINGTRFQNFVYTNFIPRYSPVFSLNAQLKKILFLLPKTLNHGFYNVRFESGIELANDAYLDIDTQALRRRKIESRAFILFDNPAKKPIQSIQLKVVKEKKNLTGINLSLNNHPVNTKIDLKKLKLKDKDNLLVIIGKNIYLESLLINSQAVNLESIDVPFISPLIFSREVKKKYQTYGLSQLPISKPWEIRSGVYNRTLDYWWLKLFYYWDILR